MRRVVSSIPLAALFTGSGIAFLADSTVSCAASAPSGVVQSDTSVVVAASASQRKYTVGILGATGTVGQQFIKQLENV